MNEAATEDTKRPSAKAMTPFNSQQYEGVYYLAIDDPGELRVAKAWFKERFPEASADPKRYPWPKITKELPLQRIGEKATIIPLIRGDDSSPIEKGAHDTNGRPYVQHADPKDLIGEVRECKPVRVGEHWKGRADEWDAFGGELVRPTFMEEIGKSCPPLAPRVHVGTPNILRLCWV